VRLPNLLGDVWLNGEPNFAAALAVPGVRLHLYEKHTPRAGRKMGHLSAVGATAEEALERVLEAKKQTLTFNPIEHVAAQGMAFRQAGWSKSSRGSCVMPIFSITRRERRFAGT
jgi:hypothetical protein